MGKDSPLCMCRFILHIHQCCDSHEDNGFAFHWSGQDGHQKTPNVLPVQLGVGAAWGLQGMVARGTDGHPTMLSLVWMDQECRYFVASASSLDSGIPYSRNRWRQVSSELDALPENVELTIPQPKAMEVYYRTCGVIDQHNQHRQANLKTKKKL